MKIVVDQELCIGAASCVAIAAQTFGLNQEGKVYVLNEDAVYAKKGAMGDVVESEATAMMDARDIIIEAARSCPVFAIKLFEDDGSEIVL
jgi:ferredoxin